MSANVAAQEFFSAIFAGQESGFLELRQLRNGDPLQDFCALPLKALPRLRARSHDVYFGVAPRVRKSGSSEDAVERRALWLDVDAKAFSGGKDEALRTLRDFGDLTPAIAVDSGHGYHGYWLLTEPVPAGEAQVLMEALRWAVHPRLDKVHDASRVLRVPGTLNHKNGQKLPVEVVHWEPERRFGLEIFERFLDLEGAAGRLHHKPAGGVEAVGEKAEIVTLIEGVPERGIPGVVAGRNAAAAVLAGHWLAKGLADAETWQRLCTWNARNVPPLGEQELREVFQSITRTERRRHPDGRDVEELLRRCTDTGNAQLFAWRYADRLSYDWKRGRWLVWKGHWWGEDADGEVVRCAVDAAKWRYGVAARINDAQVRGKVASSAIKSESQRSLRDCISLARSQPPLADTGENWDTDPWLFGVANGVVDLRTGKLRDGRQEDRLTIHTDVPFEPAAGCPRWLRFLEEVFCADARLVGFIHRAVGYSITGETREQALLILHGTGSNGKGRFLEALRHVLGPYAHNAPFSTFERNSRYAIPADVAALDGPRLVTASETTEGIRLNEGRVKALTGEDPVTARFMRENFFTFRPVCKLWLACNHKPQVADDSYGFWRRVRLVPFLQTFKENPGERELPLDNELDGKLKCEAPGILAWAVRGCLEWQGRGLTVPAAVKDATQEYRTESDQLSEFIEECCVQRADAQVAAGRLYSAYKVWADDQGLRDREILTGTMFGRRMGERFHKAKDSASSRVHYHGIGLPADSRKGLESR